MKKLFLVLIFLLIPSLSFGAAPDFSSATKSGTLANGQTITIGSASNLGIKFIGDEGHEYFDNRAAETTIKTDNTAVTSDGMAITQAGTSDIDNATTGGSPDNMHQLEHLDWLVKVSHSAACYSTGFGYRRPTGHPQTGASHSSGDNHGVRITGVNQSDVWVSYMHRMNSSGNDSTHNSPSLSNTTTFRYKNCRLRNSSSETMQFVYVRNRNWYGGSTCGHYTIWLSGASTAIPGDGVEFPDGYTDTITTGASCSDYRISDNDKWSYIKLHFTNGSPDHYTIYVDGVKLVDEDTTYSHDVSYVQWGCNHSDCQYLYSAMNENSSHNLTDDYDDLVVSTTEPNAPACVYLSNSSTWGSGVTDRWNGDSTFVRQKVGGTTMATDDGFLSWSDTGCKFEYQLGGLDNSPMYLYITNWTGETNANGFVLSGDTVTITGTGSSGMTEAEVKAGSKTIISTVSGDTFVATLGTDCQATTDYINGLDSGGSEAAGWDAQVKTTIDFNDVTRDSATQCTTVLPAVAGYQITTNETITHTVPASALSGVSSLVASPTIEITASDPACSMTGTLSDNATEAEVKAGSETLIGTVSDTELVATFGDNNAITTAFIALIDSAQSEAGGWDAQVKAALDHTMISRDSATQWTLTTPAAAGYDISANETITVKLPTTATTSGIEITCTPTADIIFFETSSEESKGMYSEGVTMQ